MTAKYSTIFLLTTCLVISGCSGSSFNAINPPLVHAGPPPPPAPLPGETLCAASNSGAEQFAHGTVQPDKSTVFETADYLQFASPVCSSSGFTVRSNYTLLFPHRVQLIDMQMGSGMSRSLHFGEPETTIAGVTPEIFEWAWWAQFDTPDGRHYEFFQQYDKHSDVQGNQNVKIPLLAGLTLPVGTVVTIFRPPNAAFDSGTQGHATGQKVELVGF